MKLTYSSIPSSFPYSAIALTGCLLLASIPPLFGADYYVDPAKGNMSNPGTSASPWSTLEAVMTANKNFAPGDNIFLRSGDHGAPVVKGHNSSDVTIQAEKGQTPKALKLTVEGASHWVISGLDICPVHNSPNAYDPKGPHAGIAKDCDYITLKDCTIRSVPSVEGFGVAEWPARTATAISTAAPHSTIAGNFCENVKWGIVLTAGATNSLVSRNTIKEFMSDGMRALANDCVFEYNTVKDCYMIDDNHDDGLQSWSGGTGGAKSGSGVVLNVTVRGNTFISYTDPNQPNKSHMQGIGCFDGMFENWVVEDNVIITDMWNGIALYGAKNCKVVNNTVLKNPFNAAPYTPWIIIAPHKNKTPSTGNIVQNNLASTLKIPENVGTVSNNLAVKDYNSTFVNYEKFDVHLKPGSFAIGAGTAENAPATDRDGKPRNNPPDCGAYAFEK